MNASKFFVWSVSLAGLAALPASAQLVHLSLEAPDAGLIIHADDASISWDHSGSWITSFDVYYDGRHSLDAPFDSSKNFARVHVHTFDGLPSFDLTRPLQGFQQWNDSETGLSGLLFDFARPENSETFELNLVFNHLLPETGKLPLPPFPELGATEYTHSDFSIYSGRSFLDYPHFAEAYGGGIVTGLSFEITPVPEPATYAVAAALVLCVVSGARMLRGRGSRLADEAA
jgi:hypothetical protein